MRVWSAAALVAASLGLLADTALAYCPTRDAARQGFVMLGNDGRNRMAVKPSDDDTLTFDFIIGDKLVATPTYYKGVYLISVATEAGTTTITYDFDYTKEPDLDVGYHKAYRVTTKAPDGKTSGAAVDNRVVGRETLVLGDCTLETLVLEGSSTFPDRPPQKRQSNFSPDLRVFVRATLVSEGATPVLQLYDRIERLNP